MSALTRQQALDCFASDDLIGLGMEADALRRQLHPEGIASYALESTLPWPDPAAPIAMLFAQVQDVIDLGMTGLHFTGPLPATATLPWLEALLSTLKPRFPDLTLSGLTPADLARIEVPAALQHLQAAGLDALSSAVPADTPQALALHRTAHQIGLGTTATLVFGNGESAESFVDQLLALRELQAETGGFTAFLPLAHTLPNPVDDPTAVESLKTLAVSRLVLDNIPHLQSDPATQGLKVVQMSLRFGANDLGNISVAHSLRHKSSILTEEELRRLIRDAGFQPAQRDAVFRTWFLN